MSLFNNQILPSLTNKTDEIEIRKSILDLLDKINKLAEIYNVDLKNVTIGSPVSIPSNTTGGIYDSGSNSNGSWIRFTDGTMIQYNLEQSTSGSGSTLLPVQFLNTSYNVVTTCLNESSISESHNAEIVSLSISSFSWIKKYIPIPIVAGTGGGASQKFYWTAIGKWK